jgi:hypothetical protein
MPDQVFCLGQGSLPKGTVWCVSQAVPYYSTTHGLVCCGVRVLQHMDVHVWRGLLGGDTRVVEHAA